MDRVALVTGGTRGIGAAIAKALQAAGYRVAANYGGNDEAAAKFKTATGIPVFKWDVSSHESCADGVKKVEAELGPVDEARGHETVREEHVLERVAEGQLLEEHDHVQRDERRDEDSDRPAAVAVTDREHGVPARWVAPRAEETPAGETPQGRTGFPVDGVGGDILGLVRA